jgi:hypothetical protein
MIDFNWLRDVAAIVDGIPDAQLNLDLYHTDVYSPPCRTIGCVAGFLCRHPDPVFNLGTLDSEFYQPAQWRRRAGMKLDQGVSWGDLFDLARETSSEDLTHKQVFARRVIEFLDRYNQPVSNEYRRKAGL